jgi:hypothetical protein
MNSTGSSTAAVSAHDLARRLAGECEQLFADLIPDARPESGELVGHLPDGGKIKMCLHGRKRGRWLNCYADRDSGDCLDLVARVQTGGDLKRAFAWAYIVLVKPRHSTNSSARMTAAPRRSFARAPRIGR